MHQLLELARTEQNICLLIDSESSVDIFNDRIPYKNSLGKKASKATL